MKSNNKNYKFLNIKKRKYRIFFMLCSLNLIWAGVIIAIVLRLKNVNKQFGKDDHKIARPTWEYDNDGNLEIHTQLANDLNDDLKQKALNNANVKGIVVDQNGVEHEIDVSIDANGKVIIPTKDLVNNDPTKPNIYTLKKVVLKQHNQPNIDLISEEQLSGDNHISFKKPTVVAQINDNNDYIMHFTNPNLVNKKIKLTFKVDDQDDHTKTIEAIIGLDGKAIFKTSDDAIFAPDHKYTLTKIEANNKKVANIDEIPSKNRIVDKNPIKRINLTQLKVAKDLILWNNTNQNQFITATFKNINDDFDDYIVKLIYEYNYRGEMKEIASQPFKLEKNKTTYNNILLPISIPNRLYHFKKVVIQKLNQPNKSIDLDHDPNLKSFFIVGPGKTDFAWKKPNDDQITYDGLKRLNIEITSEDYALQNGKKVMVWFKSDAEPNNDSLKFIGQLSQTNANGTAAVINNLNNLYGMKEQTEYYIYKIQFIDELEYSKLPPNRNNIVYEYNKNIARNYAFRTKTTPLILEKIEKHDDGSVGGQNFYFYLNKANDDPSLIEQITVYCRDNNNELYTSDNIEIGFNDLIYHSWIHDLKWNREYVFDHAEIQTTYPDDPEYGGETNDLEIKRGLTFKFYTPPSKTEIQWKHPIKITNNGAILDIQLQSKDRAFEDKQKYRVTLVEAENQNNAVVGDFLLAGTSINKNDSPIGDNNDKNKDIATLSCNFENKLKKGTKYLLKEVRFIANPNEEISAKPTRAARPFNNDNIIYSLNLRINDPYDFTTLKN